MKHWIVAIALLLIAASVKASEPLCAYADESMAVFLYPDCKRGESGSYLIWVRTDFYKPRVGMYDIAYMMDFREYSADLSKYRELQSIDYNENGKVIWRETSDAPKWKYITPNTVGEFVKEQVRLLITF